LEPQQWRREAPLLAEAAVGGFVALPYGRVDPFAFQLGLDRALDRLGVSRERQRLERLISSHGQVLGGVCPKGQQLLAGQTVLCAGAASGALLLPLGVELPLLSFSWAAVLALAGIDLGGPRILMPLQGKRAPRELQGGPDLVCDHGLAPWGEGLLLGQTSVFAGALALNPGLPPAEAPLRRGLEAAAAQLLPTLSPRQLDQAPLLQQPVAYSRDGRPLVGPLASLPGLAVFSGFAGPFALAPVLAPLLARALLGGEADRRELEALELSPDRPLAG
jgi:glycine/D-amino acid oxidase-like deaminating enzyme